MSSKSNSLRFVIALNLFKSTLLGDLHIPGRPQTLTVLNAIAELFGGNAESKEAISDRTWQAWYGSRPIVPRRRTLKVLDGLLAETMQNRSCMSIETRFIEEMVVGGLMSKLTAPSRLNKVKTLVSDRAMHYRPLSQIHLLLDSLELAERTEGFEDLGADVLREIAAQRVATHLHEKWNPRNGSFYKSFQPNSHGRADEADAQVREVSNQHWFESETSPVTRLRTPAALPNWLRTGIQEDVPPPHFYRLLFCLSADQNFLRGERLSAWVMDMASATLTLSSMIWPWRKQNILAGAPPESFFLGAMTEMLFSKADEPIDEWSLEPAILECGCIANDSYISRLTEARESLQTQLSILGISAEKMKNTIEATWRH